MPDTVAVLLRWGGRKGQEYTNHQWLIIKGLQREDRLHEARNGAQLEPIVESGDFPASRKSAYLNTASVCLMYKGAEASTIEWFTDLTENGTLTFDEAAEEAVFEDLHVAAAQLFNAQPDDIAVGSSATELLASLAWAVAPSPGANVVGTDISFPSTIYPWARVARRMDFEIRLAKGTNGYIRPDDLIQLIDDDTAAVCISDVEYSTGQRYDVAKLAEAAHRHGALLVVDASQSAGGIPIDVPALGVDALVAASYKWLCGPFGVAVMYLAPHLQGRLDPGLVGFRSHGNMWDLKVDRLVFPETAKRFEFSTMAYGCAVGLTTSIDYLLQIGVDRIFERNKRLADQLIEALRERNAEVISPQKEEDRTSIVTARFPGADPKEIAKHLSSRQVVISARRDALRFSLHLYNEPDDITQALEEIDRFLGR